MVLFRPNPMQLKYRIDSQGHNYGIIVKSRQLGMTTDAAIDMLDDACFVAGASSGIIAHDKETLGKIFQIIKRAYENMPDALKPETRYDTKNEYKFTRRFDGVELDNEIYVALKIRGTTVRRLHISEAAFIKNRDELKMGAKQAVPIGGRITEETTGNGMNEFYDDVQFYLEKKQQGKQTPQDYEVYFYPWFSNPEYTLMGTLPEPDIPAYGDEEALRQKYNLTDGQLIWRRWKLDEFRTKGGEGTGLNVFQRFKQEYPATLNEAFQSGAGAVFDGEMVDNIQTIKPPLTEQEVQALRLSEVDTSVYSEILERENAVNEALRLMKLGVKIWKLPVAGHRYVIGCDPSDGEGSDNGVIDAWDLDVGDKIEQVAQFYGKARPDVLAEINAEMGNFYNHAFVGVENNMLTTVLFLSKIYDNYYSSMVVDEKTAKKTKKLGWNTNSKTRDLMIDDFIISFEEGVLIIRSTVTRSEMKTFIKKDTGKREHANGKHDDSLFAAFIALQMRRFLPKVGRVFESKPDGF